MDVYVYLTNGNVAPLTGVTAIEEVKDYTTDVSFPLTGVAWGTGRVSKITVTSSTNVIPGMLIQAQAGASSLPNGSRVFAVASATEILLETSFISDTAVTGGVGAAIAPPESNIDSGYYRDIWSSGTTPLKIAETDATTGVSPSVVRTRTDLLAVPSGYTLQNVSASTYAFSGTPAAPDLTTDFAVTDTIKGVSDEFEHEVPRQLRYRENLLKFTCTVSGVTLDMKFRKSQVIGWSNKEPQF